MRFTASFFFSAANKAYAVFIRTSPSVGVDSLANLHALFAISIADFTFFFSSFGALKSVARIHNLACSSLVWQSAFILSLANAVDQNPVLINIKQSMTLLKINNIFASLNFFDIIDIPQAY